MNTLTDRLNIALNTSGPGYRLRLCQNTTYTIQAPIHFFAPNQEISTVGLPVEGEDGEDLRAILLINGPVANGVGHTTAVDGQCQNCDGAILRHVRINGTRLGAPPINGGANIEMGGSNSDQLIEYVRSFDPRGWSCLHVMEGALDCTNTTVRYNDIGPCGSDAFQQWADGISLSCRNSYVHGNWVNNPTDGGIVIFGSPGTLVENNTIWVETNTLLGGINMVDYEPFLGTYTGVIVRDNTIRGGFATTPELPGATKGDNNETVIIKIGIAMGPRTWFGDRYGLNVSFGGSVYNNQFTGGFGYAMAMSAVTNFTVENNVLFDNTSFIGSRGPNCSSTDNTPTPEPFVADQNSVVDCDLQSSIVRVSDGDSLTCIMPTDGDFWPFGGQPSPNVPGEEGPGSGGAGKEGKSTAQNTAAKIGLGLGIPLGIVVALIGSWYLRNWYLSRPHHGVPRSAYLKRYS
ncbi:uncharacterized protein EI90DRAFT_214800 [Cantharellus anzutake]|uniref:uncharacterized protein n=1 Tax=Cantharellus anzutake TaxID=1750568 RepID=UPI00190597BE|nr:uncharacterized protein EI90DRAFT_214800 [Cantharellus anzutake]KAF8317015.1 hypothetical protein EI90DRAFT_214800 [Cantharellus anzutake]